MPEPTQNSDRATPPASPPVTLFCRWSPKGLSESDILKIIENYGLNNDSLLPEKYEENTEAFEIRVSVTKRQNASLQGCAAAHTLQGVVGNPNQEDRK